MSRPGWHEKSAVGLVTAAATAATAAARVDDKQNDDRDRCERDPGYDEPAGPAPGTQSTLSMLLMKGGHERAPPLVANRACRRFYGFEAVSDWAR